MGIDTVVILFLILFANVFFEEGYPELERIIEDIWNAKLVLEITPALGRRQPNKNYYNY